MDIKEYIESGIIESYVLGLASAEETAELERLMTSQKDIKNAVDNFATAMEVQAEQNAVNPPNYVKDNLMHLLKDEFEKIPSSDHFSTPVFTLDNNTSKNVSFWKYATAASIIFLITSAAINFYYYGKYNTAKNDYLSLLSDRNSLQANNDAFKTKLSDITESMKLISDPAMQMVTMNAVPGKEGSFATVYWNRKTKDVYLLMNSLPKTPAEKQYQLWAIVDGKPVNAGLLNDCTGLCKLNNMPNAQAFAITLEKQGGSDTPDLKAMFVIGNT